MAGRAAGGDSLRGHFADAPTTNDAMMDYSTDLDLSIQSLCGGDTLAAARPLKETRRDKHLGDRWFSFDASGQMHFVEKEDFDFSFDDDSFCSVYDSDDECQSPVDMTDSPMTKHWSIGTPAPGHRRQSSQASTCTEDVFEGESFQVYEDSRRPEALTLDGQQRSSEQENYAATGVSLLPPLSENEPMELESPEPSYIRDTKIPIRGWFQSCRACGSWTGASLSASSAEVPMCRRCQQKWTLVLAGHDVPLYNQDGKSDLLKQHVQHKLQTCLDEHGSVASGTSRKDVCTEALLEVHQAWIVHNGEDC